jgi:hypothetical protein
VFDPSVVLLCMFQEVSEWSDDEKSGAEMSDVGDRWVGVGGVLAGRPNR